jgi:hypothetical protein
MTTAEWEPLAWLIEDAVRTRETAGVYVSVVAMRQARYDREWYDRRA